MIEFDFDSFFEKNQIEISKNFDSSKKFLDVQYNELQKSKKIFEHIEKSLLNLSDFGRGDTIEKKGDKVVFYKHNNISKEFKRDNEIFTLNQAMHNTRYKPGYQEFNKQYEFVFSGCSETQGEYIGLLKDRSDHENIWGFQIARKYNKDSLNLALQGWSIEAIVKGVMHHVRKNGNPKVLLLLLPDLGRLDFIINDKIKSDKRGDNSLENVIQQYLLEPFMDEDFKKITQSPHDYVDVIPYTQAMYRNLQSILMLDTYCKSHGIFFKYSSWNLTANFILKTLKDSGLEEYQNYVEGDFFKWARDCEQSLDLKCHSDLKKENMSELWDSGFDDKHMGIHRHIHIAERFIEEIEKDNPWDK